MSPVPMSAFVDYAISAGTTRLTQVRELHRDGGRFDFYKPLREVIADMHRAGSPPGVLKQFAAGQLDPRYARLYPKVVAGYLRWLSSLEKASTAPVWFEPPMRDLPLGPIAVQVSPEVGLLIEGRPHVIKLFMRGEPIGKNRVAFTTALMEWAFAVTWPGVTFAVLDVRRAKLYSFKEQHVSDLLVAEALSFAHLDRSAS